MSDQEESRVRAERPRAVFQEDPVRALAQAVQEHSEMANFDAKRARELEEAARNDRARATVVEFASKLGWSPEDEEWEKAEPILRDLADMHGDRRGSQYVRHAIRARTVRRTRSIR